MKEELSYIDNITGDKLKGHTITPDTSWELMNSKLTNVVAGGSIDGFVSNIGGFFTAKSIVVSVVVLSILTVGIIFLNNDSGDNILLKGSSVNIDESDNETVFYTDDYVNENVADDSLINVNDAGKTENNSEDVIIKIEVPVHENVVIKKEIVIRDTIIEEDNVKIK